MGRHLVRDVIKAERARGATVFLNSHLLGEVEVTCDRVAFIKSGSVIETREMSSFAADGCRFVLRGRGLSDGVIAGLDGLASVAQSQPDQLRLKLRCREAAPEVVRYLVRQNVDHL